jgi:uncharacterized membrane protein YuzA (DUF378 family)
LLDGQIVGVFAEGQVGFVLAILGAVAMEAVGFQEWQNVAAVTGRLFRR